MVPSSLSMPQTISDGNIISEQLVCSPTIYSSLFAKRELGVGRSENRPNRIAHLLL